MFNAFSNTQQIGGRKPESQSTGPAAPTSDDSIRQVFSASQSERDRASAQLSSEILNDPLMLNLFANVAGAGDGSGLGDTDSLSQGRLLLQLLSERLGQSRDRVIKREFPIGPVFAVIAICGLLTRLLILWDERDMRIMRTQAELNKLTKQVPVMKIPQPISVLCETSASGDLLHRPGILDCVLVMDKIQCPLPIDMTMSGMVRPKRGFWGGLWHLIWTAPGRMFRALFFRLPRWIWRNLIIGPPKWITRTLMWVVDRCILHYYVRAYTFALRALDPISQEYTQRSLLPYKEYIVAISTDWMLYGTSRIFRTLGQKQGRESPFAGVQIPFRVFQFFVSLILWPVGSMSWSFLFTSLCIALPFTVYRTFGDFAGTGKVRLVDDRLLFMAVPSFIATFIWAIYAQGATLLHRLLPDTRPAAFGTLRQRWFEREALPGYV